MTDNKWPARAAKFLGEIGAKFDTPEAYMVALYRVALLLETTAELQRSHAKLRAALQPTEGQKHD